jgi:hypothetical protein
MSPERSGRERGYAGRADPSAPLDVLINVIKDGVYAATTRVIGRSGGT